MEGQARREDRAWGEGWAWVAAVEGRALDEAWDAEAEEAWVWV